MAQLKTTNTVERELVNRSALAAMLGCSWKQTYKHQDQDPDFPKPFRDACGTQQWRRREVLDYLDRRQELYSE